MVASSAARLLLGAIWLALAPPVLAAGPDEGEKLYDFYCYQCHGYAGDARTLARSYLHPPPRDFSASDAAELSRERMLEAVRDGRPGTAMPSFTGTLDTQAIAAVVDFVRSRLLGRNVPSRRYHTTANGWPDHERYAAAYPFATGELALGTPLAALDPRQREGMRLYMQACVSCHDHGAGEDGALVWELRALSYPRRHYSHRLGPDALTGASPYAVHERAPALTAPTPAQARGAQLFQDNCAFCHAADGSGRNWIGSFLEPRPRNLSAEQIPQYSEARLAAVIAQGLPGTSMPAWRHVLSRAQIGDLVAYLRRAAKDGETAQP